MIYEYVAAVAVDRRDNNLDELEQTLFRLAALLPKKPPVEVYAGLSNYFDNPARMANRLLVGDGSDKSICWSAALNRSVMADIWVRFFDSSMRDLGEQQRPTIPVLVTDVRNTGLLKETELYNNRAPKNPLPANWAWFASDNKHVIVAPDGEQEVS